MSRYRSWRRRRSTPERSSRWRAFTGSRVDWRGSRQRCRHRATDRLRTNPNGDARRRGWVTSILFVTGTKTLWRCSVRSRLRVSAKVEIPFRGLRTFRKHSARAVQNQKINRERENWGLTVSRLTAFRKTWNFRKHLSTNRKRRFEDERLHETAVLNFLTELFVLNRQLDNTIIV